MDMGKTIQMVVFDWAGTTVDYGSSAPAEVFNRVFRAGGMCFSKEEINRPMGMEKKAHIRETSFLQARHRAVGEDSRPCMDGCRCRASVPDL